MPLRFLKSTRDAWVGFRTVWREERNFKIQLGVAMLVFAGACYFSFSFEEFLAVLFAVVLVLSAEMVNTAIEDLCNRVQPHHDPAIGRIKDIMAGYVLLISFGVLAVGITVLLHHFGFVR